MLAGREMERERFKNVLKKGIAPYCCNNGQSCDYIASYTFV